MNKEMQDAISLIMKNAQQAMQNDDVKARYQAMMQKQKETHLSTSVGGGMVEAKVNLMLEVTNLTIRDDAWEEPKEVLIDLVLFAINEGLKQAREQGRQQMAGMSQMMANPNLETA